MIGVKKNTIIITLILMVILCTIACNANINSPELSQSIEVSHIATTETSDIKAATNNEKNEATEQLVVTTSPTDIVSFEELYESVLDAYRLMMGITTNDYYAYYEYLKGDTFGLLESLDLENGLFDLGYQLRDMNEDGTPELLIGKIGPSRYGGDYDNIIYAMFTLVNGEPTKLFSSWTRNRHYLSSMGDIYQSGSSGAMQSDFYILDMIGTELHVTEGCWTDFDAFHTTDGDRFQSEGSRISIEELSMYTEQYENSILPIGDLTPIE